VIANCHKDEWTTDPLPWRKWIKWDVIVTSVWQMDHWAQNNWSICILALNLNCQLATRYIVVWSDDKLPPVTLCLYLPGILLPCDFKAFEHRTRETALNPLLDVFLMTCQWHSKTKINRFQGMLNRPLIRSCFNSYDPERWHGSTTESSGDMSNFKHKYNWLFYQSVRKHLTLPIKGK
jgi:hypothetical protein